MKRIKLVAFDIEGTLTQGLVWQKTHQIAGVTPEEDRLWFNMYYNQEITFFEWADFITKKYIQSGRKRHEFEKVMRQATFIPGVKETIRQLIQKYRLCLVSSAIDVFVSHVANRLRIDTHHANYSLVYNADDTIVDIRFHAPEDEAKVLFLKQLATRMKLTPSEIVFVGDSANDLEVFRYTKRGILVGLGNEKLRQAAWKRVDTIQEIVSILL